MEIDGQLEKFIRLQSLVKISLFYKDRIDNTEEAMKIANAADALRLFQRFRDVVEHLEVTHPVLSGIDRESEQEFCRDALKYILKQIKRELDSIGF